MINNISSWAQGIIIAIIIGTILQMIIPENKNKKYIKVVIGIYVLFCIINPVIGNSFNLDDFKIEEYMSINETNSDNSNAYESNVKNMFQQKVKSSINKMLNDEGYQSDNIKIWTDEYYNIKSIQIGNIKDYKKDKSNVSINRIDIGKESNLEKKVSIVDTLKIKKKIAETYELQESQIELGQ